MTTREAVEYITNWWCAGFNAILAVWLIIITIMLVLCQISTRGDINALEDTLANLTNVTDGLAQCCQELENLTCTCIEVQGLEVLCWDANTNTPTITSGVASSGIILYVVCTPGNTLIDGHSDWDEGDYLIFVEEEMKWLQNKAASSTGLVVSSYNLTWTCDLWPSDLNSTATQVMIAQDWYIVVVQGVGTNATGAGNCTIVSSTVPGPYQYNNTFPVEDRRIVAANIENQDFPNQTTVAGVAGLTDVWTVYADKHLSLFITTAGGPIIGFESFSRVYTTAPPKVIPFKP